jgi:prepilin-type N-terminal cleavage/methylation domain-containing protein
MKPRAFTLIELLVVIAIIGILSSVVLASLNTARTKSQDSKVVSNMDSLSSQAVIYEDTNSAYGTSNDDCSVAVFSDPTIQLALAGVAEANGGATPTCYAAETNYAVAVARPVSDNYSPPTTYWCVDTSRKCGINDLTPVAGSSCGCP